MATKKPMKKPVKRVRRFQEGGEAADKAAGLAASNKEAPVSFFERLRMGNIDQEGSEAYNRFGAGRAKMDRDAANELAASRMVDNMNASRPAKGLETYNQTMDSVDADAGDSSRMAEMMSRGRAEGERDEKRMAPSLAQTQNAALLAAKPSAKPKPAAKSSAMTSRPATGSGGGRGAAVGEEDAYRASRAAAPAAAKPAATSAAKTKEERQARIDQAFKPPSDEQIQQGLEAGTLGAGLSLKTLSGLAKNLANRRAATKNSLRLDRPGTVSGEGFVMRDGKIVKDIAKKAPQKALPSPITDVTAKNVNPRSVTGSAREDAKADRFRRGLDELSAKQMAEKNLRERGNKFLFADDAMKRGGRVKKMASGGSVKSSVSSASRRGDGIATKGKTRGKIC